MLIKITSVKIVKTIMKRFLRKSKHRVVKTSSRIRKALLNSLRSNGKQMLSKMKLIKLMMNTITCLKQSEIQLNRMNFPFVMIEKKLILFILNWTKAWLKSSSSWSKREQKDPNSSRENKIRATSVRIIMLLGRLTLIMLSWKSLA